MTDFETVSKALAEGADPALLCATCPWDRYCITPPKMSRAEVDAKMREAEQKDKADLETAKAEGRNPGMPVGMLVSVLAFAGKDTSATICPVFAMRLRSSSGRTIVDSMKSTMQGWDDGATA